MPASKQVQLADGRSLEYAEYGPPSGPLVLYFHGTPGSHLEPYAAYQEIESAGVHLIAIDRPGIGRSSYQCNRQILDWPRDVREFLEAVGHGDAHFGVVGFSGGTPYALACAREMPERISRVAIVSGHTSLGIPGVASGEEDKAIGLFIRRPKLAKKMVTITRKRLRNNPNKVITRATKRWDPSDKRLVNCDPQVRSLIEGSFRQATLCGERGIMRDVKLLGCRWGFPLAEVTGPPISIWHGGCDRIAPLSMGHYLHAQLSNSTLHVDPKSGHVTTFKWHSSEIIHEFASP